MKGCYIKSGAMISIQDSLVENFEEMIFEIKQGTIEHAVHPEYKKYISTAMIRRMSTIVKMGVFTSKIALEQANLEKPEAILMGTGMGCIAATEIFLNTVIENDEEFITPTSFIHSTHNTVAGQIALGLNCKAYNTTYVHGSASFESALMDAFLQLQGDEIKTALVGGIDELGTELVAHIATQNQNNHDGHTSSIGEGACFVALSNVKEESQVMVQDIELISEIPASEIVSRIEAFLQKNNIKSTTMDAVIFGNNGSIYDEYYDNAGTLFTGQTIKIEFKKFCGEFFTASSFGFWLGFQMIRQQVVPKSLGVGFPKDQAIETVLIYNQFKGKNHSFIILKRC